MKAVGNRSEIEEKGAAYCFKEDDICPGGQRLSNCDAGIETYRQGKQWAEKIERIESEKSKAGKALTTLAFTTRKCGQCALTCEAGVITQGGKVEDVRIAFYKPVAPDESTITIRIDSQSLRKPPTGVATTEAHRDFTEAIEKLRPMADE